MKEFIIIAYGHPLIKAMHRSTLEITKDNYLTERGDCIIGIRASHSCSDLPIDLKRYLLNGGRIEVIFRIGNLKDKLIAYGDKNLILKDDRSIVIRKSNFIDARTLAIRSNKAAKDINREIIKRLVKGEKLEIIIRYL